MQVQPQHFSGARSTNLKKVFFNFSLRLLFPGKIGSLNAAFRHCAFF